jgi:hypothetical protein
MDFACIRRRRSLRSTSGFASGFSGSRDQSISSYACLTDASCASHCADETRLSRKVLPMRHIHFVSFATVATLIGTAACGSDSAGGGSGGTSAGGTSSGGTSSGGSAGSSTGGSAGVGTGGVATGGAAGSGTGGVATGGAAGGIATGGTGGGATGACTNAPDQAIITAPNSDIEGKVGDCGQSNFGAEPGTSNCIKQQTGLSDPCVACFSATIKCAIDHCVGPCLFDQNSAECIACRAQYCDGPFEQCSGLTVD